jgi:glutamate/tyrosine decarboxylase-like PLP-dependent enzyme
MHRHEILNTAAMLTLPKAQRLALWQQLIEKVEEYFDKIDERHVALPSDPAEIRALLEPLDFQSAVPPNDAIAFVVDGLWRHQVHTSHARYFGLFNPNPTTMSVVADLLVAAFNPQLAAWSHTPFPCEIEQHVVRHLAARFGYDPDSTGGYTCHRRAITPSQKPPGCAASAPTPLCTFR